MNAYVGITDYDWYQYLAAKPDIEEINFWQPSGSREFKTLQPGELFLFKLHSPRNYIVGGGFFTHASLFPVSMAWDAFGEKNGVGTLDEMRARIGKYRRLEVNPQVDYQIGCILLAQPFFYAEKDWIAVPEDWNPNIVQGKHYDLSVSPGKELYAQVEYRLHASQIPIEDSSTTRQPRYGNPVEITPRLGQGAFRMIVTDIYERRCAVTRERSLPVLDAAHIKPFSKDGTHAIGNGLLLRADIHRLFDAGYVTVTPDYHFEVSSRLKADYENGRDYYTLHGKVIWVPESVFFKPSRETLSWHNSSVYRG